MATTSGVISLVSKTAKQVKLAVSAASGGTGPYTYQWYRSTTSGFTIGGGNILTGKTGLTLQDDTVVAGTTYYYKNVATDSGAVASTSAQLGVDVPLAQPGMNTFGQAPYLGMIDERLDYNTIPCMVDISQSTPLVAGQAVKVVDSAGGVPKIVACSANADDCFGFINFNTKDVSYAAGKACEVSCHGNCIYLRATGAIARMSQVQLDVLSIGGVAAKVGSSGADVVGYAFDKASAPNDLIRVMLKSPSFTKA